LHNDVLPSFKCAHRTSGHALSPWTAVNLYIGIETDRPECGLPLAKSPHARFVEDIEWVRVSQFEIVDQRQPPVVQHIPRAVEEDGHDRMVLMRRRVVHYHELHIAFAETGFPQRQVLCD
jgi:hypothetical protein